MAIAETGAALLRAIEEQKRQAAALLSGAQGEDTSRRAALEARAADIRAQNEAEQRSAVSQLMQQMQLRGEQAKRAMQNAPTPPSITPNAAPLKEITGVSLVPGMAGANNARSAFFLSPEASQSQFAVGAPVGGGNIGQRQKGSTSDIVSQPDNLNSSRKGKF